MNKKKPQQRTALVKESPLEKEPSYMVQIPDPKMLRKDILESLREIILFMQGYEKFKKIQEEKVATFTALKNDVKELNTIINTKLRTLLPKGKLKPMKGQYEQLDQDLPQEPKVSYSPRSTAPTPQAEHDELDELEGQLKDIEGQLRSVR